MRRALSILRGLWPRRLAGQLIALLLVALMLSQAASIVIFMDERRVAIRSAERKQILERTASVVRLIESTPAALHGQIVRTPAPATCASGWPRRARPDRRAGPDDQLQRRLKSLIGDGLTREVVVELSDDGGSGAASATMTTSRSNP